MWCFIGKPAWTDRLWYVQHSARGLLCVEAPFSPCGKYCHLPFPKEHTGPESRDLTAAPAAGFRVGCVWLFLHSLSYLIWFLTCQTEGFILSFIQQIFEHRHCTSGHTEHSSWIRCWGLNSKTGPVCSIPLGKTNNQNPLHGLDDVGERQGTVKISVLNSSASRTVDEDVEK